MKKKIGFGVFVSVLSVINLINVIYGIRIESLLISIIGIIGSIFYLRNKKWSIYLLLIWTYSQLITLEPIFDASQIYSLQLGFFVTLKSGTQIEIAVNVLGVIYASIVKFIFLNTYIGKEIRLKSYKQGSFLTEFLPSNFAIIKIVRFKDGKRWFLIK